MATENDHSGTNAFFVSRIGELGEEARFISDLVLRVIADAGAKRAGLLGAERVDDLNYGGRITDQVIDRTISDNAAGEGDASDRPAGSSQAARSDVPRSLSKRSTMTTTPAARGRTYSQKVAASMNVS